MNEGIGIKDMGSVRDAGTISDVLFAASEEDEEYVESWFDGDHYDYDLRTY